MRLTSGIGETAIRAGVLCTMFLLLAGCGGAKLKVVGNEFRLTAKEGSEVVGTKTNSEQQRVALLIRTLKERRHKLGGKGVSWDELDFVPYAETTFTLPNGDQQILTVIYQAYKGARVIDGLQYGSFETKHGRLQSVRAFLKDPATLPDPPAVGDMKSWSKANQIFRDWLRVNKATKINFVVEERPVISARLHVAGYLARYAYRNPDGSHSRFAAIIDPTKQAVHVLYDIGSD